MLKSNIYTDDYTSIYRDEHDKPVWHNIVDGYAIYIDASEVEQIIKNAVEYKLYRLSAMV